MQQLVDGLRLYHGSYTLVECPDIAKCAKFKDFGQGFYLTSSLEQARSFASLSLRKAKANGLVESGYKRGWVSSYLYHDQGEPLSILAFDEADEPWLHCVVAHRKEGAFPEVLAECTAFDVIAGKIANDATNATITTYMAGAFGPLGSSQADEICISLLLPERLTDQFCFRSEKALAHLAYEGGELV